MRLACLVDVFVRRSVSFVVLRGICDALLCPTMFRLSRPDIGCPFLEIVRYFRFVVRVVWFSVYFIIVVVMIGSELWM